MAQVNISINNRPYTVACEDGQESRLAELATSLDEEVKGLAAAVGQVGDTRLLVIAGLSLIDRLSDDAGKSSAATDTSTDTAEALAGATARAAKAEERLALSAVRTGALESQLTEATRRLEALAATVEETA